ncbi:unnamed protein product [Arctia plantaginis]|uniref:Uncharacterized protein n=1 Tax=Arctia plantaginis TaxID=874455 RepID=A0A8S0ZT45_ARCPL|nr:unnamed protein product [Arctia plantaginis]
MSAVMSTLSMISGGRRAHRKLTSSNRKSGQFSDVGEDRSRSQHDLNKQQRSASLVSYRLKISIYFKKSIIPSCS